MPLLKTIIFMKESWELGDQQYRGVNSMEVRQGFSP